VRCVIAVPGAEQHDVLRLERELSGCEAGNLLPIGRLGVPIEVLESLPGREPGRLDPHSVLEAFRALT